jgi:hypothetical protein
LRRGVEQTLRAPVRIPLVGGANGEIRGPDHAVTIP